MSLQDDFIAWDRLARFRLELTNSVGQGPYLEAIKRADVTLKQPLTSGSRPHFLIVAASDHDAAVFRGEVAWEWIKRCSQDAGLTAEVVIAVADEVSDA